MRYIVLAIIFSSALLLSCNSVKQVSNPVKIGTCADAHLPTMQEH